MTGKNVGEWSELYALATLLATSASSVHGSSLPKAKRIRHRHSIAEQSVEYVISQGAIDIEAERPHRVEVASLSISELSRKLLSDIQEKKGRTFHSEAGAELAEILQFTGAGPTFRDDLQVQWAKNFRPEWLGLSVKSLLGAKPTLLNASSATNFTFKLVGNLEQLDKSVFSQNTGMKKLFTIFNESGVALQLVRMDNEVFYRNLTHFSDRLPETVGTLLVIAASHSAKSMLNVWEEASAQSNSLAADDKQSLFEFLGAVGLGLRPAVEWVGREEVGFGGFVVVNRDGTVHISDESRPSALGEFLFRNLKFEWGSRDRHKFGIPFLAGDQILIRLNLQLRFMRSDSQTTPTPPSP
ncbi:MAG: hypothetical protein JW384_01484 [Nitrosomonadaceae bacterium]|nr:hypothetical protein [Nitrosomonadaceae bacterium]